MKGGGGDSMFCRDKKLIGVAGLLLALALWMPQLVLGTGPDGGLDCAMQAFSNAMKSKNAAGILAAFSRNDSQA